MDRLPIIDIAPLYGADRGAWNDVARRIDQACREWGFFYIAGHPLPAARFEALLAAAREFPGTQLVTKAMDKVVFTQGVKVGSMLRFAVVASVPSCCAEPSNLATDRATQKYTCGQ